MPVISGLEAFLCAVPLTILRERAAFPLSSCTPSAFLCLTVWNGMYRHIKNMLINASVYNCLPLGERKPHEGTLGVCY